MFGQSKTRFWRVARRGFRWFRIIILLLVLAVLVAAIWLNRVGLPPYAKARLVAELQRHGVDLQFSRLRLHWYRGVLADDVRFGRPADTNAPRVSAAQAELLVSGRALLRGDLELSGLALRGATVVVPVWGTNATPREVVLEKMNGEVRFSKPDTWELVSLRGRAFGVNVMLGGTVTNATAVRNLSRPRPRAPREKTAEAFWYDFIRKLEVSKFQPPAEIAGNITGDAKIPGSFRAFLSISSPGVISPWGSGDNVKATAQLAPSAAGAFHADVKVEAYHAVTEWARAGALKLEARIAPSFTRWTPTNADLAITLKDARTRWGNAGNLSLVAHFDPSSSDVSASLAHYTLKAQQVDTKWAKAARLELTSDVVLNASNLWPATATARLRFAGAEMPDVRSSGGSIEGTLAFPSLDEMQFGDTNVTWWTRVDKVRAGLAVEANDLRTSQAALDQLALNASWAWPALALRDVRARLYDGEIAGSGGLDSATRRLHATARTTVDPHKIKTLLDTNTQKWLAQFTWDKPPRINATAEVTLPAWTNGWRQFKGTDWDRAVLPTLAVNGDVEGGRTAYRGVVANSARTSFAFSNLAWRIPDLVVTRPEGRAFIAHAGHSRTRAFTFDIDSTLDPAALKPLFGPAEQEFLDLLSFTNAPHVRAQVAGRWHAPKETSVHATVAATNLSFRGLPVREARSVVTLTNQVLTFLRPEVVRSEGQGRAVSVVVDIPREKVFINHATGSLDPWAVTHAVGEDAEEAVKPYKFINPPVGYVHGYVDTDDALRSDLRFELAGGPFEWEFFRFQQITGVVHWAGSAVTLSNVVGSLHGGHLEGSARFDFQRKAGAKFGFRTLVTDINLNSLVEDLGNKSNKVEGALNGLLVVTNANTDDLKSWHGYGNLAVNEGVLWDFPVFGLFSPVLNAIKEGAGNSRAKDAVATFGITNSIIYTSDLTIHASGMRLKYEGTVDFDTRVNGRMSAQLFRDTPAVGSFVSKMLWPVTKLFEYRITGTLAKPSATPVYLPRILSLPLQSLRTLRDLAMPDEKPPVSTNSLPASAQ